ncbi:Superfamily II DNA or RNA helicase [Oribacterium sp. KHPX15]|nr:Superfamily II DNA or RNA helicase [Oribacterium sp. KHPX15]
MENTFVEVKSHGLVSAKTGRNSRIPYEHQKKAMENLDIIDECSNYSTLVVLPTGGGKTYTASLWLLKHALNKHKKILWIAHRQMLLDQAAESFQKYAYSESLPNASSFNYRIVSGSTNHDRSIDITPKDDLLIASKDSIGRNMDALSAWINGEKEVYLVIDEAHHSTAKTYRKIIDYVKQSVKNAKIIGLTATPIRTADSEQGLLAKIFSDGVSSGKVTKGNIGITYQIGLKDLINRRILSKPIFESCYTEEAFGDNLGLDDWEKISHLDVIPDSIAGQMAKSAARNKLIVDTYKKHKDIYGQTIVFAVNVVHAIALSKLFNKSGIPADFIVSDVKDSVTGVTISREDNERKLEAYRSGKINVLVNVNILTEGVDLPQTKTVFLARPTVSTILMTQMIGRALRGEAAGGTPDAHIVSFIDNWNEHIAWINPENLFIDTDNDFIENDIDKQKHDIRMIAISKIEEFASILDDSVDTTALERVPFEQRIPIGMYVFSYLEENGMDHSYQVMVYDSTKKSYEDMMEALPVLFKDIDTDDGFLPEDTLKEMADQLRDSYFLGEMIPPYSETDVIRILKYYAQYEAVPKFYTFDAVDKSKLDVAAIAKHIWDEDMGPRKKAEYVDSLWDSTDDDMLRLFFGRKVYFWKQLDIEMMKLSSPDIFDDENNVKYGTKEMANMSLYEIRKLNPNYEKELRDEAFAKAKDDKGYYVCAECGMKAKDRIPFQVDHIIPMNKGGKTIPENLQILCRSCNAKKSDKL